MDIYTRRHARLIVDYSIDAKENQEVVIYGSPLAGPLIKALYRRVLERGAHPHLRIWLPGTDEIFYRVAADDQIDHISDIDRISVDAFDAGVSIMSSQNTRSLTNIPAERISRRHLVQRPLFEKFMDRITRGELKWCGTIVPTNAYAQDAEISLQEYSRFLYKSCCVDQENYIDLWKDVSRDQSKMVDYLSSSQEFVGSFWHREFT